MKRGGPLRRRTQLTAIRALARKVTLRKVGARARREAANLRAFRKAILERAAGKCERCGRACRDLEAHHRLPRARGGAHAPSNGAGLCWQCHDSVHDRTALDWREWVIETKPGAP